ncbi:MAG: hypothetical protein GY822_06640 [Deltaproteobacteria bacterium]|nr:hypothetical protein [Deltaproteobacteria bacterium]
MFVDVVLFSVLALTSPAAQDGALPVSLEQVLRANGENENYDANEDDTKGADERSSANDAKEIETNTQNDDDETNSTKNPSGQKREKEAGAPVEPNGGDEKTELNQINDRLEQAGVHPKKESAATDRRLQDNPPRQQKGKQKWEPLPQGSLFPREKEKAPGPKLEPPKLDSSMVESIDAQLSSCSLFPVQSIVGWLTALAVLPVSFCTCGVGACAMPSLVSFAQVSFGDSSSNQRGSLLAPFIATHCTYAGCTGIPLGLYLAVVGVLVMGIPIAPAVFAALAVTALWAPFVAVIPILLATTAAVAAVGALSYSVISDDKEPGDDEVRFPGFFSPAHRSTLTPEEREEEQRKFLRNNPGQYYNDSYDDENDKAGSEDGNEKKESPTTTSPPKPDTQAMLF